MDNLIEKTTSTPAEKKTTFGLKIGAFFGRIFSESFPVIFWIYIFLKLFVIDIDVYFFNRFFPNYSWLLNLKVIFFASIISLLLLGMKYKNLLWYLFVLLFYPLLFLFIRIPYWIFKKKSWNLAFLFINGMISYFRSFKYNFIFLTIYLIALALLFNSNNPSMIWISLVLILILILISYFQAFVFVFKPSAIFQVYLKIFSGFRKFSSFTFKIDDEIKNLPVQNLNQQQLQKWTSSLQMVVLCNRLCLYSVKKLRDYSNSGLNIVSYILNVIWLFVFTVISFAAINFGLYRINKNYFVTDLYSLGFFNFVYYSFNRMFNSAVKDVDCNLLVSQTSAMLQSFMALLLIAILITLFFSVRAQKHTDELNDVIKGIKAEGKIYEGFIMDEFKIKSIEEAITELNRVKAGLIQFIFSISENLE